MAMRTYNIHSPTRSTRPWRLWGRSGEPVRRAVLLSLVGVVLYFAPSRALAAQIDTSAGATSIRAWAFARAGVSSSAPVSVATSGGSALVSVSAGAAASLGMLLAMVRVSDNAQFLYGPEI